MFLNLESRWELTPRCLASTAAKPSSIQAPACWSDPRPKQLPSTRYIRTKIIKTCWREGSVAQETAGILIQNPKAHKPNLTFHPHSLLGTSTHTLLGPIQCSQLAESPKFLFRALPIRIVVIRIVDAYPFVSIWMGTWVLNLSVTK